MTKTLDESECVSTGSIVGADEVVGLTDVVRDMADDGPEVAEARVVKQTSELTSP